MKIHICQELPWYSLSKKYKRHKPLFIKDLVYSFPGNYARSLVLAVKAVREYESNNKLDYLFSWAKDVNTSQVGAVKPLDCLQVDSCLSSSNKMVFKNLACLLDRRYKNSLERELTPIETDLFLNWSKDHPESLKAENPEEMIKEWEIVVQGSPSPEDQRRAIYVPRTNYLYPVVLDHSMLTDVVISDLTSDSLPVSIVFCLKAILSSGDIFKFNKKNKYNCETFVYKSNLVLYTIHKNEEVDRVSDIEVVNLKEKGANNQLRFVCATEKALEKMVEYTKKINKRYEQKTCIKEDVPQETIVFIKA